MDKTNEFADHIRNAYQPKGHYIAMLNGETFADATFKTPLKTIRRQGPIAETGKSTSLQFLADNHSQKGVPVLLKDQKGDLNGITKPSSGEFFFHEHHKKLGFPYESEKSPVKFLTISKEDNAKLRAVREFGPMLLSQILDIISIQEMILAIIFKYCDDIHLPLLHLKDLKK